MRDRAAGRSARVVELPQPHREAGAEQLRQLVLGLGLLSDDTAGRVIAELDGHQLRRTGWRFVMLGPVEQAKVLEYLLEASPRPQVAVRVWAQSLAALRWDTGEVAITRDELAQRAKCDPDDVSRVMSLLERVRCVARERRRVAGMRGPGKTVYRLNPWVATHLCGDAREQAQAEADVLQLPLQLSD